MIFLHANWELRSCPVSIKRHCGSADTAQHLDELVREIVVVAGLSLDKDVVSVTHDTAPVMNSLGRSLTEVASRERESGIPFENIGCICHILNVTTKLIGLDPVERLTAHWINVN